MPGKRKRGKLEQPQAAADAAEQASVSVSASTSALQQSSGELPFSVLAALSVVPTPVSAPVPVPVPAWNYVSFLKLESTAGSWTGAVRLCGLSSLASIDVWCGGVMW
jgi:hypothetical protein